MGTTVDKLNKVLETKLAIKEALNEKLGEDVGDVFSEYADKIQGLEVVPGYYRTAISIDQSVSDPSTMISKIFDDGAIEKIRANSHRYAGLYSNGTMYLSQLQDNDGTKYLDGSEADITNNTTQEIDVFLKLPEFYYRAMTVDNDVIWNIEFVYGDVDHDHMISEGFKYWDGNDLIGVYEAYMENSKLYSISGVLPRVSTKKTDFDTYAANRGDGYSLVKWEHHSIMGFLFYAYYLHTDSQSICGHGTDVVKETGQTNLLCMEDTVASINGDYQSINFWGLENWWGNIAEFIGNLKLSLTVVADDSAEIEENGEIVRYLPCYRTASTDVSYENAFVSFSAIYIGSWMDLMPVSKGNSTSTTYFCDSYGASSGSFPSRQPHFARSGIINDTKGGISFLGNPEYGFTDDQYGSRLAFRGDYIIVDNIQETIPTDYIELDGTWYIDTGFLPNSNTKVEMTISDATTGFLFGTRDGSVNSFTFYIPSTGNIRSDYNTTQSNVAVDDTTVYTVINKDKNVTQAFGTTITATEADFQCSSNLYLFNLNGYDGVQIKSAKFYDCKIYDNGVLVKHYRPYKNKYGDKISIYEEISKTFVTKTNI